MTELEALRGLQNAVTLLRTLRLQGGAFTEDAVNVVFDRLADVEACERERPVGAVPVDWKFAIEAVALHNGKRYTEDDAVLFLCKDLAFGPALNFYRAECERLRAAPAQLAGIDLLIRRVHAWQVTHRNLLKVPDVDGEEAQTPPTGPRWGTGR